MNDTEKVVNVDGPCEIVIRRSETKSPWQQMLHVFELGLRSERLDVAKAPRSGHAIYFPMRLDGKEILNAHHLGTEAARIHGGVTSTSFQWSPRNLAFIRTVTAGNISHYPLEIEVVTNAYSLQWIRQSIDVVGVDFERLDLDPGAPFKAQGMQYSGLPEFCHFLGRRYPRETPHDSPWGYDAEKGHFYRRVKIIDAIQVPDKMRFVQ